MESKIETAVSGKTAVLGKVCTFIKNLVGQKARRQAPPLPHGSYATDWGCSYLEYSGSHVLSRHSKRVILLETKECEKQLVCTIG